MGTDKLEEKRQRTIVRTTHKQRRALRDTEQWTEKDAEGLRLKSDCHEKMRVAMATQEPHSKHVSRGGLGDRVPGPGLWITCTNQGLCA